MESPGTGAGGGLASFFAEREMLKREMLKREMQKREMQKCKWLDNKKGGLSFLGLSSFFMMGAFLAAFLALSLRFLFYFLSAFYCFDNQSLSFWSSSKSFSEKRLV